MNRDPSTPINPRQGYEDAFEELYTPIGYNSPNVSFESLSNGYIRSQQHVKGLRAVVPGFNGDAPPPSAYMMATAERHRSVNAYHNSQIRVTHSSQTADFVRFDGDEKTVSVPTHALSPAPHSAQMPPKSALHHRPVTAPELQDHDKHGYHNAQHEEEKRDFKIKHRQSSEVEALHKTVRQGTVERILARSESDSYRSYCTRSVKGLRLNSSPPKPVRIQDPAPEPVPYKPVMRSRTQRRKDEREEEERKKEAARSKDPVRRNPDGTPLYATVSHHKEQFDSKLEQDRMQVQDYENHVKRIRQDRSSLLVIKGADGKEYKYNERGFKVATADYVKPRVPTPPKIEHHGPFFRGDIIHKTQSHVKNMRRMIKLRHEQARWDSQSFPWTTFSPVQESNVDVYAPKNAAPGSAFHRDVLKYGNAHANSNTKFGVGNSGKRHIGAQDSPVLSQGDIDLLPLKYLRSWPEYETMQPNDVTITIEHCHSCHKHQFKTRHVESKYLNLARDYRQIMIRVCAQFACRLSILMKPIVDHDPLADWNFHHSMDYSPILVGNPGKSGGDKNSFTRVDVMEKIQFETNTNRCGAFEIQVALKQASGQVVKHILFSKLFYGAWPCRPDIATLMDALMSANMFRLPEELPLSKYSYKLTDSKYAENIIDTREMSDPAFFADMKRQDAIDNAIATLLQAQKLELEELDAKRKLLDADMAAAEKRAKGADAKLVFVRMQNAELLKNNRLKALKAAEMQHRAWGAALDEVAWELKYTEMVSNNPDPQLVPEEELEQTLRREIDSVNIARESVDSADKVLPAILDKHGAQLHRLKQGGLKEETLIIQEAVPLQELESAEATTAPMDGTIGAEITVGAAENEKVAANPDKVRAELKVELEAALHQEMQDKLEAAILKAKREAEAAMRIELQAQFEKERAQREALETDLKEIRDKATLLEKKMAEEAAKRLDAENLAVVAKASLLHQREHELQWATRESGAEVAVEGSTEAAEDDIAKSIGDDADDAGSEFVNGAVQTGLAAYGAVTGGAIGAHIGVTLGKIVGPAATSVADPAAEFVEFVADDVTIIFNETTKLAVHDSETKLEKIDSRKGTSQDELLIKENDIDEVDAELNLAALEQQSPAFPKIDDHDFDHDESFWDSDSKDGGYEVSDRGGEASTNDIEHLLFDD